MTFTKISKKSKKLQKNQKTAISISPSKIITKKKSTSINSLISRTALSKKETLPTNNIALTVTNIGQESIDYLQSTNPSSTTPIFASLNHKSNLEIQKTAI